MDIVRYWLKSAHVNLSRLYLAPPVEGDVVEISPRFLHRKTRVPGIVDVILGLAIFVQL